ncbi:MAG TPA: hypothetical protein VJ891_16430, partial [Casimicrobiaceae bacterium]|nr:hypothetical protein [Casimicrobiaceae bacterium]
MSCALASTAALAQAPGDSPSDPASTRADDAPRVSIRIPPALFDRLLAADAPGSKSELFGDDTDKAPKGESRDKLFGEEQPAGPTPPSWHGFVRGELAYTYGE